LVEKSQLSLRDMAEKRIKLDPEDTVREVIGFIGKLFHESKASGIVVGLSGGIDSAVTCSLCVRAVGAKRVLGYCCSKVRLEAARTLRMPNLLPSNWIFRLWNSIWTGRLRGSSRVLPSRPERKLSSGI